MENLIKHCTCAGDFQCLISKEEFNNLLKIFYSLSEKFQMPALNQTLEELLLLIN